MRFFRIIFMFVLLTSAPLSGWSTEADLDGAGSQHEEGLSAKAVELFSIDLPGGAQFPITNSMLVTWIVALVVIIFAQVATRNMKAVPEGAQNFWEWMVES